MFHDLYTTNIYMCDSHVKAYFKIFLWHILFMAPRFFYFIRNLLALEHNFLEVSFDSSALGLGHIRFKSYVPKYHVSEFLTK